MLKKSIATIIIVVAIMGIAFAAYSSANTKNPGKNSTSPNNTTTVATNLTGNNNNNNNNLPAATSTARLQLIQMCRLKYLQLMLRK